MPDRRRSAMAILMAASIFALPTSLLAAQDEKESTPANANASLREAHARQVNAAPKSISRFFIAGPSRYAYASAQRPVSNTSQARQYTEEELREIRAAQIRLIRDMGAGPGSTPGGTAVLSHPTLGRIVISSAGPITPKPGGSGTVVKPTTGLLAGPTSTAGTYSSDPKGGSGGGSSGGGDDFPVLTPGSGFSGPTALPPAVGNPHLRGYDAKAIARWDVVPYQDFDGLFHIGVVAFHMNGIDRVEFSANGGPWTPVTEMKLNPRTDVWEYTATLDASQFEDGLVEVRARVFPRNAGEVRVLGGEILDRSGEHSMVLNANAGGTWGAGEVYVSNSGSDETGDGSRDNPFASIWKAMQFRGGEDISGVRVKMEAGDYSNWGGDANPYPLTSTGWVTIEPADGVAREEVRLIGGGRFKTKMVRFYNITFDHEDLAGTVGRFDHLEPYIWLDDIVAEASDRMAELVSGGHFFQAFLTDSSLAGYKDGSEGMSISRNVTLTKLGSDAFGDSNLVLNSSVDDIAAPAGSGFHADVFQFSGRGTTRDNTIVYGLRATNVRSQGIFADDLAEVNNSAFVNVLIDSPTHKSQWKDVSTNHLLLWHVSLINQSFAWRTSKLQNVSIAGSLFERVEGLANLPEDATIISNHVVYPIDNFGDDLTTGPPMLTATLRGDYHPLPGSPLRQRLPRVLVPIDSAGHERNADVAQTIGSEEPIPSSGSGD